MDLPRERPQSEACASLGRMSTARHKAERPPDAAWDKRLNGVYLEIAPKSMRADRIKEVVPWALAFPRP